MKNGKRHYHCPSCDYTTEKFNVNIQSKFNTIQFCNHTVERCFCDNFKKFQSHFHCPFCHRIRNRQGFLDHVKRGGCLKRNALTKTKLPKISDADIDFSYLITDEASKGDDDILEVRLTKVVTFIDNETDDGDKNGDVAQVVFTTTGLSDEKTKDVDDADVNDDYVHNDSTPLKLDDKKTKDVDDADVSDDYVHNDSTPLKLDEDKTKDVDDADVNDDQVHNGSTPLKTKDVSDDSDDDNDDDDTGGDGNINAEPTPFELPYCNVLAYQSTNVTFNTCNFSFPTSSSCIKSNDISTQKSISITDKKYSKKRLKRKINEKKGVNVEEKIVCTEGEREQALNAKHLLKNIYQECLS